MGLFDKIFDINRRIGGDVLNLSGSKEPDLLAQRLGLSPPTDPGRSNIGKTFTSGGGSISEYGVTVDPRITQAKERGEGMISGSLSALRDSRESLGSREDFMANRMAPLVESTTEQRGSLQERQGKTGIAESEFGRQSVESFDIGAEQTLAQSQAGAFNEFEQLSQAFDQSEAGLLKMQEIIQSADFAQQAMATGMSTDLLSQLVDIHLTEQGIRTQKATAQGQKTGTAMSLIGSFFSSRTVKNSMEPLDNQQILDSMMELDVEKWKYNGEDVNHIGCYAEDFNERFGIKGKKTIDAVDIIGVLMASIQAQQKQIDDLKEGK